MKAKTAIIYTRVSSDEQAREGYSLQYQEEQLRKYCTHRDITIIAHYKEDYSAKTFDRPEFNKLLSFCKKNQSEVDYLLFVNWSRFGRNAGDSYSIIKQLGKLDIEPQAIEQPLDLKVPENKMMLAFYLATPEVENDRRSLNVRSGLYRARKEGRWTTHAPVGYRNIRTEDGRAMIIPSDQAELVREAFREYATGTYGINELCKKLVAKGLKSGRSSFNELIRNKTYIGLVYVPAYKDELAYYTKGIHEPLISEKLFYQVQDLLEGRSPNRPTKNTGKEELPLRGFLECRQCGKNISGSASRGNGGRYFYYHCTCGCNERFKAHEANKMFLELLQSITPNPAVLEMNYEILMDEFTSKFKSAKQQTIKLDEDIKKNNQRIQNAQHLMLDAELSAKDYKEIKVKLEAENDLLLRRKSEVGNGEEDFKEYLRSGATILRDLDARYQNASLKYKQLIIGSVFPEKLIFEKNGFRTNRVNEAVQLICMNNSQLDQKKSGRAKNFLATSAQVEVR
ncbi:MAG: recombinase family protein [Cyclobacteriaceae bacterium]|nr:recombinase family protein [Cyclobacteriaceae bacterium]